MNSVSVFSFHYLIRDPTRCLKTLRLLYGKRLKVSRSGILVVVRGNSAWVMDPGSAMVCTPPPPSISKQTHHHHASKSTLHKERKSIWEKTQKISTQVKLTVAGLAKKKNNSKLPACAWLLHRGVPRENKVHGVVSSVHSNQLSMPKYVLDLMYRTRDTAVKADPLKTAVKKKERKKKTTAAFKMDR